MSNEKTTRSGLAREEEIVLSRARGELCVAALDYAAACLVSPHQPSALPLVAAAHRLAAVTLRVADPSDRSARDLAQLAENIYPT